MTKSIAQLRKALATEIRLYHAAAGNSYAVATAGEALLAALDAQPSRQGKPYRVSYMHTRGIHAGRVYNDSHYQLEAAARQMRTVISVEGRVTLSVKDDNSEWHEKEAAYLSAMGYNDIAGSGQYGLPQSQEA